jgi:hypothetical protein
MKGCKLRLAYDVKLKRPGCILFQAALGGDTKAIMRFPTETWLIDTPGMSLKLYEVTEAQLAVLVALAEAQVAKGHP